MDDFYDIAIFGYLSAVERYIRDPPAGVSFEALAIRAMKDALHQDREYIDGTVESMREIVGGELQAMYPAYDVALVFNESATALHLPRNRGVWDADGEFCNIVCGTFFLCGAPADSNYFTSLSTDQIRQYAEIFAAPEVFLNLGGRTIILPCKEIMEDADY